MSDENDSWLEGIGVCVQKFFSSEPDNGGTSQAPPAPPIVQADANGAPTSLPTGGNTPASAPASADPDKGGSSKDPRAVQADYDQGYRDGSTGKQPNPGPRAGDALEGYNKGHAQGMADYRKKEDLCREYNRGFQDKKAGKPSAPGPLSPDFLAEYERGYAAGQQAQDLDASDFGPDKPLIWLTVRGVVYGITKVLDIGGGLFRFIVVQIGSMKCDSPHFRFKCPTCGAEGDLRCTAEEAAEDRKQHKEKFPDHVPTSTPPQSWTGDPP